MEKKHLFAAGFLGLSLTIGGCGALENMDKMKGLTEGMNQTTNDMKVISLLLQREARQGAARVARQKEYEVLNTDGLSLETRMVSAGVYFSAFEFQLWENIMTDDEPRRQTLLEEGTEEFMVTLRGLIGGKRKDPNPLSTDTKMQALFALAATAERLNSLQVSAGERTGFKPVSMLDLITEALVRKPEFENNLSAAPGYIRKILFFEDEARYFLNFRYNIYPAVVLDKIYDVSQRNIIGKLQLLLKKQLVVDMTQLNAIELDEMTNKYLRGAIDVRHLMRALGEPIKMNKNLTKILSKRVMKDDPVAGEGKRIAADNFKTALQELLCESDACPADVSVGNTTDANQPQ